MKQYKIRNNSTGEMMTVSETELPKYGISSPSSGQSKGSSPTKPPSTNNPNELNWMEKAGKTVNDIGSFIMPNTFKQLPKIAAGETELQKQAKQDIENIKSPGNTVKDIGKYMWHGLQQTNPVIGLSTSEDYRKEIASPGLEISSWMMGSGKTPKSGNMANFIGRKFVQGAGEAGTQAISDYLGADKEDKELASVFKKAASGGIINVGMGLAGKLTSKAWKTLTNIMPKSIYANTFTKASEADVEKLINSDAPGNIKKMQKYGDDIYKSAEKKLQLLDSSEQFSAQDLFGNVIRDKEKKIMGAVDEQKSQELLFNKVKSGMETVNGLVADLNSKGRVAEADKLKNIVGTLNAGDAIGFQDALWLKRTIAENYPSGKLLEEVSANKKAIMKQITDSVTESVHTKVPEAQKLLETEKLSLLIKDVAEAGSLKKLKSIRLSPFDVMILAGSGVGTAVGGPAGLIPAAALIGAKSQSTATAKGMYKAGNAVDKLTGNPNYQKLQDWMRKAIVRNPEKI